MLRRIAALLILAIIFGGSVCKGDWTMRTHMAGGVEETLVADIEIVTFFDYNALVHVPAGFFIMGDGEAPCGIDEREVTLTHDFYLGQHEVTNLEFMRAVQWAYDQCYVGADEGSVWDSLDGSTQELMDLNHYDGCEIAFDTVSKTFYLVESSSSDAQSAYPEGYDPGDHPVKFVSWYGAARYCDWLSMQAGLPRAYEHTGSWACGPSAYPDSLNPYAAEGYRLATDAEWEYAAQYDDERIYPWGNSEPNCELANFRDCVGWTHPVCTLPWVPGSLKLCDMAGNLHEYCNDWLVCSLGTDPATDPVGPATGTDKLARSSYWFNTIGDRNMRCAARGEGPNGTSSSRSTGLRIAMTVMP